MRDVFAIRDVTMQELYRKQLYQVDLIAREKKNMSTYNETSRAGIRTARNPKNLITRNGQAMGTSRHLIP
jgi:hypothetical protein